MCPDGLLRCGFVNILTVADLIEAKAFGIVAGRHLLTCTRSPCRGPARLRLQDFLWSYVREAGARHDRPNRNGRTCSWILSRDEAVL